MPDLTARAMVFAPSPLLTITLEGPRQRRRIGLASISEDSEEG